MCNSLFETISSIRYKLLKKHIRLFEKTCTCFIRKTYVFFLDIFFEGLFVNFEKVYTFALANKRVGDLL